MTNAVQAEALARDCARQAAVFTIKPDRAQCTALSDCHTKRVQTLTQVNPTRHLIEECLAMREIAACQIRRSTVATP